MFGNNGLPMLMERIKTDKRAREENKCQLIQKPIGLFQNKVYLMQTPKGLAPNKGQQLMQRPKVLDTNKNKERELER